MEWYVYVIIGLVVIGLLLAFVDIPWPWKKAKKERETKTIVREAVKEIERDKPDPRQPERDVTSLPSSTRPTPAGGLAAGEAEDAEEEAKASEPATLEEVYANVEVSCLGQTVPRRSGSVVPELDKVGVSKDRNVLPIRIRVPAFPAEHRAKLIDAMRQPSNWSSYPAGLEIIALDHTGDNSEERALDFDLDEPVDFDAGFRHPMRIDPVFRPAEDTEANVTKYWVACIDEEAMEVEVRIPFAVRRGFPDEPQVSPMNPEKTYHPSYILVLMDFGGALGAKWGFKVPLFMADPRLSE